MDISQQKKNSLGFTFTSSGWTFVEEWSSIQGPVELRRYQSIWWSKLRFLIYCLLIFFHARQIVFGEFHSAVKDYITSQTVVQEPSADHAYNERAEMSFANFVYEQDESIFQLNNNLSDSKPTSADVERFFSSGRLSKNFLQSRMSSENHSTNVFLKKKKINFVCLMVYNFDK